MLPVFQDECYDDEEYVVSRLNSFKESQLIEENQNEYHIRKVINNYIKNSVDMELDELVAWTSFLNNPDVMKRCYIPTDLSYWKCGFDINTRSGRITPRFSVDEDLRDLSIAERISLFEEQAEAIIFYDKNYIDCQAMTRKMSTHDNEATSTHVTIDIDMGIDVDFKKEYSLKALERLIQEARSLEPIKPVIIPVHSRKGKSIPIPLKQS
jgi:hypothetical protein